VANAGDGRRRDGDAPALGHSRADTLDGGDAEADLESVRIDLTDALSRGVVVSTDDAMGLDFANALNRHSARNRLGAGDLRRARAAYRGGAIGVLDARSLNLADTSGDSIS